MNAGGPHKSRSNGHPLGKDSHTGHESDVSRQLLYLNQPGGIENVDYQEGGLGGVEGM